ncbi:MAG: tRNA A37 threonylcarbamoyladenosine synthetase subunit TsaC/SUA5/YrdC [Thermoproteota archaeon]
MQASKTDKEIGIRFCPNQLTKKILDHHDGLLLSTNIPKEKLDLKEEDTIYGYLIEDKLSHSIDLIIDPGELEFVGLSTVISFYNDEIEIIREGAGPISSFQ